MSDHLIRRWTGAAHWRILPVLLAALTIVQPVQAQTTTAPLVTVTTAKIAPVEIRVPVSATLVARSEVLIFPQISGYSIQSINVDVGDKVAKGDVLATLDSQILRSQLVQAEAEYARAEAAVRQSESQIASAQASLTQANAVLERSRSLKQSGNVSQAQLDQAVTSALTAKAGFDAANDGLALTQAQLRQTGAQRDLANLNLSRSQIRAPADGIISERNGQIGAIATPSGAPIFKLIKDGVIEAEAELIETSLGQVSVGDIAQLTIAGEGQIIGKLRLIYPTVDPQTRLGTVRISFNPDTPLRTGVYAGGWIIVDRHDGLTVPTSAVLTDAAGAYVLVVVKDTLKKQPVTAGPIWADRREILRGLSKGDTVVAKAGAFFLDGDKIRPKPLTPSTGGSDR